MSSNIPSGFHLPSGSGSYSASSAGASSISASGGSSSIPSGFHLPSGSGSYSSSSTGIFASSSSPWASMLSTNVSLNIPEFKIESFTKDKCHLSCNAMHQRDLFNLPHCNGLSPMFHAEQAADCVRIQKTLYDCRWNCDR